MYDRFYDTVKQIIDESGIEPRQIAVELTETQNESDFELIKERINELKDSGIKFIWMILEPVIPTLRELWNCLLI